jgi:hypothetical protein
MVADSYTAEQYIARRRAFAQAIEACKQLIRDYEAGFNRLANAEEIEAVKTAILRIECAEAADRPTATSVQENK